MTNFDFSRLRFSSVLLILAFVGLSLNPAFSQTSVTPVTSDSLCIGDTVKLAASHTGGGFATFSWADTSGASTINPTTGDTVSVYPTVTTHYRVIGDLLGAKDTTYFTVTVNPLPTLSITKADSQVCKMDSLLMVASGASSYSWSSSIGGVFDSLGPGSVNFVPDSNGTAVITLNGTDNKGCSNSMMDTVTVFQLPNIMLTKADTGMCLGDSMLLTASGGVSYQWMSSLNATFDSLAIDSVNFIPDTSGSASITLNGTDNNGCKNTYMDTVEIYSPIIKVSISDTTPCFKDTITLIGSGANSYKWYSTASATTPFATGDTVTDVPNGSRTYWAEGDLNGCVDKDSVSMNMKFGPREKLKTKIGAIKASNQVCVDDSIQIYAETGANMYTWSSNLGSLSSTSGSSVFFKGLASGQATVTCKIDSSNGCSTTINEIFYAASVKANATHSWLTDSVICQGDTARVQGFGASNFGGGYYWKPGTSTVDSLSNPVELIPMVSTTYYMEIVFNGCRSWDTVELTVNPVPDMMLSKASTSPICKDEADTITITSTRGVLFDWGFGVISAQKVKTVTPGYTRFIVIKAFSAANCVTIDSIKIDVDTTCGGNLSVQELSNQSINTYLDLDKKLNIQFGSVPPGNVEVELIDLTGSVVKRAELGLIQNADQAVIYCNDLNNGIYLRRIKGEEYEVVRKILK